MWFPAHCCIHFSCSHMYPTMMLDGSGYKLTHNDYKFTIFTTFPFMTWDVTWDASRVKKGASAYCLTPATRMPCDQIGCPVSVATLVSSKVCYGLNYAPSPQKYSPFEVLIPIISECAHHLKILTGTSQHLHPASTFPPQTTSSPLSHLTQEQKVTSSHWPWSHRGEIFY